MISPRHFHEKLESAGVNFSVGVPDSILRDFCDYLCSLPEDKHLIAANEGCAIGIAAGRHMGTGGIPLVYLQNSGLGNAVNPLVSLTDPDVYAIPMILLIGWRGEPDRPDEPQHMVQGRITPGLLDILRVPWKLLGREADAAAEIAVWAVHAAKARGGPVAILVGKNSFAACDAVKTDTPGDDLPLSREEAIDCILDVLPDDAAVVATTGKISRELDELRQKSTQKRVQDFLTVGSMGHCSQIACGLAAGLPDKKVICLDGDGAILMHMGGLATIGSLGPSHFTHILLNNGAHDSVGGHPTVGFQVDFRKVAEACGYRLATGPLKTVEEITSGMARAFNQKGPHFIEIHVRRGSRKALGRPAKSPRQIKEDFSKACLRR